MNVIEFAAEPTQVEIDCLKTAVIVVDMQNDFAARGGMFDLAGHSISDTRATIPSIAQLLTEARASGILVVYLQHGFQSDLDDVGPAGSKNRSVHDSMRVGSTIDAPDGSEGRILVHDTWNTQIVDELQPRPGDWIVRKNRFSGFFETPLDAQLRERGVESLLFVGTTASNCVEATLRDANARNYKCVLVKDCVGEALGDQVRDASFSVIAALLGWTSDSAQVLAALREIDGSGLE